MSGAARPLPEEQHLPLEERSALGLANALRRGETTAQELARSALERAESIGGRVGAFAHLLPELTLAQAERADAALHRREDTGGRTRSLLRGVPMPIKALSNLDGAPADGGSRVFSGRRADRTDGVVQDVLDAGTLTVGLTTAPEFGMPAYTEPDPRVAAPARTPWDVRRTAGGSSGGAGAAVASGIVPLAHGTDGGGSVRIPAGACGVVGIKPSRGLVSSGPFGAPGAGLVTDGVLARTVRDAALGLDAIARTRPGDPFPQAAPERSYLELVERAPGPLRIGMLTEPLNIETDIHPASLRAVERAVRLLRGLGHVVEEVPAPFAPADWRTFMPLWTVSAASIPVPSAREGELMELTRWLRAEGERHTAADVMGALSGMQRLAQRAGEAFAGYDLILTPSLNGPPAFPETLQLPDGAADFDAQCRFTPWTASWNMFGWAALSVPLHREAVDGAEMPFGVHLAGTRPGQDALLLQLSAQLEERDPWPLVIPPR